MKWGSLFFLAVSLLAASVSVQARDSRAYDFTFPAISGGDLSLADYAGKVVLVVNTASQCGFTGQYEDLQTIWQDYRDRGLVVIGVPSNDFGGQEPGNNEDIKTFCTVNFDIDFPMTEKVVVQGAGAHPFYQWARQELGSRAVPRWNFHKYLINRDGKIIDWFSSMTNPSSGTMRKAIEKELVKSVTQSSVDFDN